MPVTFVDVARKPIAATELRRFTQRFGAAALLDRDSARYRELGLGYMSMGEEETFERILDDQQLLVLPLVRAGDRLTVGVDEPTWRGWLTS